MTKRVWRRLALVAALLLLLVTATGAQDNEATRKSLRGLDAVRLIVEHQGPANKEGLERILRTDVELKLRPAGILVVTTGDGVPVLYLYVHAVNSKWATAYGADVELRQDVLLQRDPRKRIPLVATWSVGMVGSMSSAGKFEEHVRKTVRELMDDFLNAWLSVNPENPKK